MRCYLNPETEPAFNIAAEEYLLKNSPEDCFMLWRNHPAVIVGRNQNALSQINLAVIRGNGIRIVRRISGGGAVYHDLGNVNFTFIKARAGKFTIDFCAYTLPIVSFLNQIGVPAIINGHNDLTVDGLKISGNAQHVHKHRVLHHGTLLFDADLKMLEAVLKVDPTRYTDKAVPSIRSRVTNIQSHMTAAISIERFMERLMAHICRTFNGRLTTFATADTAAIDDLAENRYRRWKWTFGGSPAYHFHKKTRTVGGTIDVSMEVEEGTIRRIRIFGDNFGPADIAGIETRLIGCRHRRRCLQNRLDGIGLGECLRDVAIDQLLDTMF